jgi:hypothetical protein
MSVCAHDHVCALEYVCVHKLVSAYVCLHGYGKMQHVVTGCTRDLNGLSVLSALSYCPHAEAGGMWSTKATSSVRVSSHSGKSLCFKWTQTINKSPEPLSTSPTPQNQCADCCKEDRVRTGTAMKGKPCTVKFQCNVHSVFVFYIFSIREAERNPLKTTGQICTKYKAIFLYMHCFNFIGLIKYCKTIVYSFSHTAP